METFHGEERSPTWDLGVSERVPPYGHLGNMITDSTKSKRDEKGLAHDTEKTNQRIILYNNISHIASVDVLALLFLLLWKESLRIQERMTYARAQVNLLNALLNTLHSNAPSWTTVRIEIITLWWLISGIFECNAVCFIMETKSQCGSYFAPIIPLLFIMSL